MVLVVCGIADADNWNGNEQNSKKIQKKKLATNKFGDADNS